ncbi:ABC transporter ATP-binding protein [Malacoplasma iowae]|uniref:ABC transporter ATP-binding protein n=1 Tax=Malacoplasma iowae TaxID=2116 RepID=UPI002A18D31F|nr:ABC transporter ATP-binding protein [Malacoplasma iowae]WPL38285.1 ABC transporter ATP-binding protein [Malacoplasma iowae]WPL41163.1 ABC transporter ATP-binding protein [Malacoplasma iowae]
MDKKNKSNKMTTKKMNNFLENYTDKDLAFDPNKKTTAKKVVVKKEKQNIKFGSKKNKKEKLDLKNKSKPSVNKEHKVSTEKSNVNNTSKTNENNNNNQVAKSVSTNKSESVVKKANSQIKPTQKNKDLKQKPKKEKKAKKTKEEKIEEKKRKKELRTQIKKIKYLNKPHKNEKNVKPKNYDKNSDIIVLENVNKLMTNGYSCEHILKDVSLKIKKGEFVVIYGPSGSGKTTLLTLISALDRPSNGVCYMFNKNTISLNESQLTKLRSEHVGYIFQQYGLLTELSVYDNIKLATSLQPDKKKLLDIDELLKSVDLFPHKYKKASNLSGGQAQRVAICRALVRNPDILYGDEPTGAIHIDATKQIMNIFCNINQKFKTTVVIVTHNEKILELGDHIIKVDSGKIIEDYINKNKKTVAEISWE